MNEIVARADHERWLALMQRLELGANETTFDAMRDAWSERQRCYHTTEHLEHCLAQFDAVAHLAEHPAEVELALWFHDAIYNVYARDNELRSAEWAERFLTENGVDTARAGRVHNLIMATEHTAPPGKGDTGLLVDIDLSILGADEAAYARFEENVRREYRWVPGSLFRRNRRKILQSFLDRDTVYRTPWFLERLEKPARANLKRAIASLA